VLQPVQLRTLQEVLLTGSLAAAGARLGFTASAVSQQIAALERQTGLVLFERGPRSVRPTAAAHALAARVGAVLGQLDLLEREFQVVAGGQSGVVRLGSFPTASAGLLPPALARLERSHPGVRVLLDEAEPGDLLPRLSAGTLDLVLVYEYEAVPQVRPSDVERSGLLRESLVVLLPRTHPLAGAATVALADLAGQTWASSREGSAGARSLARLCATAGFEPRVAYRSNDYAVVRGLVAAGLGVALVPALAHHDDPGVAAVGAADDGARRHVFALRRRGDANPLLEPVAAALLRAGQARARKDPWAAPA